MNNAGFSGLDDMAEFGRKMFQGNYKNQLLINLFHVTDKNIILHPFILF